MVIDCDRCVISGAACVDCVVTVLEPRNAAGVPSGGLAELGVARISVGGAFAFAALGALTEAARELQTAGTYGYLRNSAIGREIVGTAFA